MRATFKNYSRVSRLFLGILFIVVAAVQRQADAATRTVSLSPTETMLETWTRQKTRSATETPPWPGPELRWIDHVGGNNTPYPAGYVPTLKDVDLHTGNFTLVIRVYQDEIRTDALWLADHDAWRGLVNFTIPGSTVFHPRGVLGRKKEGFVLTREGFSFNATHITILLEADSFIQLRHTEIIEVQINPRWLVTGMPTRNSLMFRVTAREFPRDWLLVSLVSVTNFLAALATLFIGVPGSTEVQAAVMLGRMSCVTREAATFTDGTENLIAPTPFFADPHGRLAGNMFLIAYFLSLHSLACYLITKMAKAAIRSSGDSDTKGGGGSTPKVSGPVLFSGRQIRQRLLYPSLSYGCLLLLFPGTVYFAVRSSYSIVSGPLTLIIFFGFLLSLGATWWFVRYVMGHRHFSNKKFVADMDAPSGQHRGSENGSDDGVPPPPSCAERVSCPTGRWSPFATVQMYRTVIGEIDGRAPYFIYLPFVYGSLVAAGTALDPTTQRQCYGQFTGLTCLFLLSAAFFIWKRPYRYLLQNVWSALSNVSCAILTVASAVDHAQTPNAYRGGLFVLFGVTVLRSLYVCYTMRREWDLTDSPDDAEGSLENRHSDGDSDSDQAEPGLRPFVDPRRGELPRGAQEMRNQQSPPPPPGLRDPSGGLPPQRQPAGTFSNQNQLGQPSGGWGSRNEEKQLLLDPDTSGDEFDDDNL